MENSITLKKCLYFYSEIIKMLLRSACLCILLGFVSSQQNVDDLINSIFTPPPPGGNTNPNSNPPPPQPGPGPAPGHVEPEPLPPGVPQQDVKFKNNLFCYKFNLIFLF